MFLHLSVILFMGGCIPACNGRGCVSQYAMGWACVCPGGCLSGGVWVSKVGSTHPAGMHSCFKNECYSLKSMNKKKSVI